MRKTTIYIMIFLIAVIFTGCSSLGPKIIEKSSSKERWVKSENLYFEENDALYFRGEVGGVYDLALGKRQAEADAKKRLVEAVSSELTSEYREFIRGSNTVPGDVGRFVDDALESVSRQVNVSGMLAEKAYWERLVERSEKEGSKPYYHIFSLVRIAKKDYEASKDRVVRGLLDKTKTDKNKEAEQMIEEWKRRRDGGLPEQNR
ncbi:MAG: hypothetical protein HZA14_13085 [Nitrospirae bacterium]|nr:hypothetical protein [Nitrospirota bacterium]